MHIDFYDFGRIKIEGEVYERDMIIFPDRIFSPWTRKQGHYLDAQELSLIPDLLKEKPELVIIGIGYSGAMQVNPDVEEFFKTKRIEIIIQKTIDAWKTYNELSQSKKTIALLHLTC